MSVNEWIGEFPSSQGLSIVCILLWIATGIVMLSGNYPAAGWVGALETVTFASVMHYGVKRFSYKPDGSHEVETTPPPGDATGKEAPPIG